MPLTQLDSSFNYHFRLNKPLSLLRMCVENTVRDIIIVIMRSFPVVSGQMEKCSSVATLSKLQLL